MKCEFNKKSEMQKNTKTKKSTKEKTEKKNNEAERPPLVGVNSGVWGVGGWEAGMPCPCPSPQLCLTACTLCSRMQIYVLQHARFVAQRSVMSYITHHAPGASSHLEVVPSAKSSRSRLSCVTLNCRRVTLRRRGSSRPVLRLWQPLHQQ